MSALDSLDRRYRLILCDVWGVVHDGVKLYPGAADRLRFWRNQGRRICLITNAPRTAEAVKQQLARIGLPDEAYDDVVTSGEAGIAALNALGRPVGFIGSIADRTILEGRGVRLSRRDDFADLACTGTDESRPDPSDYEAELGRLAKRGVRMHCLNPDRIVVRGGVVEACAGAIAESYEGLGGTVIWYGKPYPAIYAHATSRAEHREQGDVLAIGDGLQTDMLGAARMGFDAIFVSGGIHAGAPFPENFAQTHGLTDWAPIAVVEGLS